MSRGTATQGWVSDEAWRAVATDEGRLDPDERRAYRRAAVGVVLALVGAVLVWWLGLFSPHLSHGDSSGSTSDAHTHTAVYEFDLQNRGMLPVTVTGADLAVPGVVVTATRPARARVVAGASEHVKLALHVERCTEALRSVRDQPSGAGQAIRVAVARPWGTVHATVRPPAPDWLDDLLLYACGQEPTG